MGQVLRHYQERALAGLRASVAAGRRRVLLVSPTGSGKTTIASALIVAAREKGKRVLFVAHRSELVLQCLARLEQHGVRAGLIMAGHASVAFPVQVASVQTLIRRAFPPADLIVVDEAHHARARSYQRIVDAYPGAPIIGLSATPWRTDGRGLGELFEDLVVAARPAELVAEGYLVPATGFTFDTPDLSGVRRVGGDYEEGGAATAMSYIGGNIVRRWLDSPRGRTVVFACTVAHSQGLTAAFRAEGVRAEHLDGTTPAELRAAILGRLASGETELVSNVAVLTEGWDLPALECVVLARPTKSLGLYLQMAGRGLRPADGKDACRIHDHAGNALRHGLVDADHDYSLDPDTKRESDPVPAVRVCKQCFATFKPAPKCPVCGFEVPATAPREGPKPMADAVEVAFSEIRPAARVRRLSDLEARGVAHELAEEAARRGYKPGWAKFQFKTRFGWWPRNEWFPEAHP